MIDIVFFGLLVFIGLMICFLGFMKKQYSLMLFGGLSLFFAGLLSWTGIEMQTGLVVQTVNDTVILVTNSSSVFYDTFPSPFAIFFILFGLGTIFFGVFSILEKPPREIAGEGEYDDE